MYCRVPENWEDPVSSSRGGWMHSYSRNPSDDSSKKPAWQSFGDDSIRTELVARVRKEIALGIYDTPEKMEVALERLFQQTLDL
jgi:hypothetical protein